MTTRPHGPPFGLLVGLTAASPFAMNAMLPAFPAMQAYFHTSYAAVQLALTLPLVAFGLSQLVLGQLSDRLGRRPVMLGGILLFVLGSLIAALATTTPVLVGGRVVQGVGGAAGMVLGRTIANDMYRDVGAASAIGYLTMAMALAQMLAPWFGGVLDQGLGWQSIFWCLTAAGIGLMAMTLHFLSETHPLEARGLKRWSLVSDAAELVQCRAFWSNAGNMAFASGMYFAVAGAAPYIVETQLGWSQSAFGLLNALPALGYAIGNFMTGRLAPHIGSGRLVTAGMAVAAAATLLLWLLAGWPHPLAIFIPVGLISLSNGMTLPSNIAGVMAISRRLSGSASGLTGALQMLVGAGISSAVGLALGHTTLPLLIGVTVALFAALGFYALDREA